MKKILAVALTLALILTLAACGGSEKTAEYKLGLGAVVSMDSSSDKTEDKDALAQFDTTCATVVLDKDGKIIEDDSFCFVEETKVCMYPFAKEEAEAYVATKEPMDKAGAYGIQGIGAFLVEKIIGEILIYTIPCLFRSCHMQSVPII